MRRLLILALLALPLYAASWSTSWSAASGTGALAAADLSVVLDGNTGGTVTVEVTGDPTGCQAQMEGSIDGSFWFVLGDTEGPNDNEDCTTSKAFHWADKPVRWIRPNVTTLSGGTTPTVTIKVRVVE